MKYGWITETDAKTIEATLDLVCSDFPSGTINTCEIGVREGKTSRGMRKYLQSKGRAQRHTGIDNQHDLKIGSPFIECFFIIGNSNEVYNQVADASQHFIFIDGNHSFPMTVSDFFCYKDKVVEGGYMAFHDCGMQIPKFKDYQGMGSKRDPDMYISCRKAIDSIGLITDRFYGWKLIFDEADKTKDTGGVIVIKKDG